MFLAIFLYSNTPDELIKVGWQWLARLRDARFWISEYFSLASQTWCIPIWSDAMKYCYLWKQNFEPFWCNIIGRIEPSTRKNKILVWSSPNKHLELICEKCKTKMIFLSCLWCCSSGLVCRSLLGNRKTASLLCTKRYKRLLCQSNYINIRRKLCINIKSTMLKEN